MPILQVSRVFIPTDDVVSGCETANINVREGERFLPKPFTVFVMCFANTDRNKEGRYYDHLLIVLKAARKEDAFLI